MRARGHVSASPLAPLCAGCSSVKQVRGTVACRRLDRLIDLQAWPAAQQEYGRLRRSPGLIAGGLAPLGLDGLFVRRRIGAKTGRRLLGKVELRRLRRGTTRRRLDEPVRNRR
jgi:hypothetical protein